PTKLPEVARSIGRALGEFRRMADDVKETLEQELTREEDKEGESGEQKEESPPEGVGPDKLEKETSEGTGKDERKNV
ncbi:MAG: twin-arginine translocase TatA/TatE family subunit, partial [Syntrophorhabdales bacterium]